MSWNDLWWFLAGSAAIIAFVLVAAHFLGDPLSPFEPFDEHDL